MAAGKRNVFGKLVGMQAGEKKEEKSAEAKRHQKEAEQKCLPQRSQTGTFFLLLFRAAVDARRGMASIFGFIMRHRFLHSPPNAFCG